MDPRRHSRRPRHRTVASLAALALLVGVLASCTSLPVLAPPDDGPGAATITTDPALYPVFRRSIVDYVSRCDAAQPVSVDVAAPAGTTVAVDGQAPQSGDFSASVTRAVGQQFTIVVHDATATTTHHVRCLPTDFPAWTSLQSGTTAAAFYVTIAIGVGAAGSYPVVFDTNGVPVWWGPKLVSPYAFPIGADTIAWYDTDHYEQHALDGTLLRTFRSVGADDADQHDLQLLPNGDYLVVTETPKTGVDLSSWGGPTNATITDHIVQEIDPSGALVWSWRTSDHISIDDTTQHWRDEQLANGGPGYDPFHWNSVEWVGDGVVLSFRHLDAVYRVDKASGAIVWKLGGTPRAESLTVVGDPAFGPGGTGGFGGQHDARVASDGSLTVYDDGTGRDRAARGVVYTIDTAQRTATFVRAVSDAAETAVRCCGGFVTLPNGNYVSGWGGNPNHAPDITEETRFGARLFSLSFTGAPFVYRAIPLFTGQVSRAQFRAGMDAQYGP